MRSFGRCVAIAALAAALLSASLQAQSTHAAELFQQARARETDLRKEIDTAPSSSPKAAELLARMRTLARTYEDLWRLFPTSAYSDDALWRGAKLAADVFWQSAEAGDRTIALRLFQALAANFPTSSLLKRVPTEVARLEAAKATEESSSRAAAPSAAPAPVSTRQTGTAPSVRPAQSSIPQYTTLTAIRRDVLPDALRVTLELEREPVFSSERIDGPARVFIDLQNTRASSSLKDATLPFADDVVRQIRVGRQLNGRTRVVLDLSGAGKYSVYALYNPFRIIVDFERKTGRPPVVVEQANAGRLAPSAPAPAPRDTERATRPAASESGASWPVPAAAANSGAPATAAERTAVPPPAAPRPATSLPSAATNSGGSYSLSRQLGLGIARIVIDPGHGGHDPGARGNGLSEAAVTLDIALRLEKLFAKQSGVEVVLTRRDDTFVQLQERTASANRSGADLFLSIHANASEDAALRGIETYFLNLSPNPEAGRIAARENATSSKTMHDFSDIVKAIALNDKLDESRDFATMVQTSMFNKLKSSNKDVRNLGVKQAPFMVLVGATMPSILAEIAFITNKQEGSLLKTEKYRQQVAEALYQGIMRYQQSLKKAPAVAQQDTSDPPSARPAATR